MNKIIANCETGEVEVIEMTPEEETEYLATLPGPDAGQATARSMDERQQDLDRFRAKLDAGEKLSAAEMQRAMRLLLDRA